MAESNHVLPKTSALLYDIVDTRNVSRKGIMFTSGAASQKELHGPGPDHPTTAIRAAGGVLLTNE
jgi:hypothetical protein